MTVKVYIGLGSNLHNPEQQIVSALQSLREIKASRLINNSGLFRSPPMGPQDQPDYLNAAALIETELTAELLLDQLQNIENTQGRVRSRRWGERTLDLDILLYGDEVIHSERLTIPHAGLALREFVLHPLQRLNPALNVPGKGKIIDLVEACPASGIEYLGPIND
ncbi:MAG: 2-amino-4-hydroxy-6-hydroxymethyldihydropteridine diphosphokinase [Gammaproteobacteria bacterium]|nr:2-amino-4-hydroxy-6-hydroxymethyldihydropteridine diphosphokinase [Gammaproteobacteria bacterium]